MANVTKQLQTDIKTTIKSFNHMFDTALDLENLYWKGSVGTDLTGSADGDAVTDVTQLTKSQVITILSLAEHIRKFFDNVDPAQSDYMTTCQDVLYGTATSTFFNNTVEAFGNKGVQFARDCVTQFNRARSIENVYNSSELGAIMSSMSTQTIVYGSDMTKDQLTSAVTLMQNWQGFMSNVDQVQSDRKVTLAKWYSL